MRRRLRLMWMLPSTKRLGHLRSRARRSCTRLHGAQLLVDKYEADPILSLPAEHEHQHHHVGKKRGRQPQLGVSAMDYALKALFAMVRSNPEEKEEEEAAQKQKKMEQLMATVEYLRTFDQAYIMDEDLEDVDEEY